MYETEIYFLMFMCFNRGTLRSVEAPRVEKLGKLVTSHDTSYNR